jgi:uncharacterized SAM-binding protein YcdF (DUF218 family)
MIKGPVASGAVHAARASLAILAAAAVAWLAGLIWFAEAIPRLNGPGPNDNAISQTMTDAVVVLTGGPLRLRAGLEALEAGRAHKLFVSGVHPGVELAELLRAAGQPNGKAECCIVLGHSADNTEGNASETRAWMAREGFRSLRLVTASYHLRRSLLEFRHAMPEIAIVPHPVFTESFRRESWWAWPGTLSLVATEYTKYLAAIVRLGLAAAAQS